MVFDIGELSIPQERSRRNDLIKPWFGDLDVVLSVFLSRIDFKTCFVFWHMSHWMLFQLFVLLYNFVIASSFDYLKEVWHCCNFTENS